MKREEPDILKENKNLKQVLEKKNRELENTKRELEKIKKEFDKTRQEFDKTKQEFDKTKREFEDYKARHPETVGVKNGKPYVIRPSAKSSSPKKPGARKGHKPIIRKLPEYVDTVVSVPIDTCPCCGGSNLSDGVQENRERIVEDIPVCKPIVTKFVIERRYCRDCKKLVETPVTQALPKARIGIRTMLMIVYLKIGLRMPIASIPQLLKNAFGLTISEGGVCLILEQIAEVFGPYYDQLIQEIRNASARHMDETGWRINGENVWLWVFITKGEALYKIASSRGHEVPLKILGEKPKGVDVHDRHSAYKTLARKTGKRPQQYCWAHIICNAEELAKFYGPDGEYIHKTLQHTYQQALKFDHKGTDEDIDKLYNEMKAELTRKSYKSHKCCRFVENLLKEKDNLFQFVKNPEVEATNNRAERALRHSVIARKISGGNKTPKGAQIYETLTSIYHTLQLRNQDLLTDGPHIIQTSHG